MIFLREDVYQFWTLKCVQIVVDDCDAIARNDVESLYHERLHYPDDAA